MTIALCLKVLDSIAIECQGLFTLFHEDVVATYTHSLEPSGQSNLSMVQVINYFCIASFTCLMNGFLYNHCLK